MRTELKLGRVLILFDFHRIYGLYLGLRWVFFLLLYCLSSFVSLLFLCILIQRGAMGHSLTLRLQAPQLQ